VYVKINYEMYEVFSKYNCLLQFSVSCPPLSAPDNGMIDCTGNVFEDTCTFSCDDNYDLVGSETRTCQSDRTWSGTEATCTLGDICKPIYMHAHTYWIQ